jgi:prepilin-type N-terminal cleavage/methylation domain-containing protein
MLNERRIVRWTQASALDSRPGFTLIELTVVSVVFAIATAVVVPQWSRSLENARASSLRLAVETDMITLCRTCTRQALTINLTVQPGTSRLTISPPLPNVLGDASGVIDYSERFAGILFTHVDFNGSDQLNINHLGELISNDSTEPLNSGLLTIQGVSAIKSIDLLTLSGGLSNPTSLGGE